MAKCKLIEYIGIVKREICDHKLSIDDVVDDLLGYRSWFINLISSNCFESKRLKGRLNY